MAAEQDAGSRLYVPFVLYFYDFWVLWLSNNWAWLCPTASVQLPLFRSALGRKHLDIGVGTGYYPTKELKGSKCEEIALLDLNPNALATAKNRVQATHPGVRVSTFVADATVTPLSQPDATLGPFDSASAFFLLHCLQGPTERKAHVFEGVASVLADEGQFVGTTILGSEKPMNWFARRLMTLYNKKGVFDNWGDKEGDFERELGKWFGEVEVWTVGRVMLWRARRPRVRENSQAL